MFCKQKKEMGNWERFERGSNCESLFADGSIAIGGCLIGGCRIITAELDIYPEAF